ncbi:MAG: hypothetical protein Q8R60_03790 [Mycobacteriales bacterium]|nr:hypothetical protein [Mycobacteriales bacterium]
MRLTPTTLAMMRRAAVGTVAVAAGGLALVASGPTPAGASSDAPVPGTTTSPAPVVPAPEESERAFDPSDCPGCGLG